jgi:hypothetical protein
MITCDWSSDVCSSDLRNKKGNALVRIYTHREIWENHLRNFVFLCENLQNLQKESESKDLSEWYFTNCSVSQPPKRRWSYTPRKVKWGTPNANLFNSKVEYIVVHLVLLKGRHCSNSWSTNLSLKLCSGRAKGKLGGVCWRLLTTIFSRQY